MTYLQEEETDSVPTDRNAKWQFCAHRCDCWLWGEPCFRALIWVCLASIKRHLKDCELAAKSLAGSKLTTLSSRKETLRLVTDSTARPNLVQKQVDISALYRILQLAIIVTSNCEHFNKKKMNSREQNATSFNKHLTHRNGGKKILWGLNSWFTGLSSEPCPGRGRESTEQDKWMTLVVEVTPYGRQRSEAFHPLPHTWDVPPRKSQKRKSRERERYSPNIASHPRFKLTWAEETVRETFESLDGEWVYLGTNSRGETVKTRCGSLSSWTDWLDESHVGGSIFGSALG